MKNSVQNIGKILGITVTVYVGIRWLLPIVIPFLIAFLIAKLLNPIIEKLNKKWKLKRGIVSTVLVGIFLILTVSALLLFIRTMLEQVKYVIGNLDSYQQEMGVLWNNCCGQIEDITGIRSEIVRVKVENCIPALIEKLESKGLPSLFTGTVTYAKNFIVLGGICFVVIISTILILKDYHKIREGLLHNPVGKQCLKVCRNTYQAGGAYLKTQLIIMFAITIVCVSGLYFSGNHYALLAGCGIGLCDAMPFLGTGTVFVPWAIIELIQGKYVMAAIYTAIYAVCSLVREILEPKLLGNKLGMHPLMVLASIYAGLHIYGLWGFALGPFSYILIREIYTCNS